jgi:FkbM family methyltransferase
MRNSTNPTETLRYLAGVREKAQVNIRGGPSLECKASQRQMTLNLLRLREFGVKLVTGQAESGWRIDWRTGTIEIQGIVFEIESVDPVIFCETFLYDVHFVGFSLVGKYIVDVGGFVGDTALYYASKGANVLVYEPNPVNYRSLIRNLDLNPALKCNIKAFQRAVGAGDKVQFAYRNEVLGDGRVLSRPSGVDLRRSQVVAVDSVTLSEIVDENKLTDQFLLKSDCKGCEIILIKDAAISLFPLLMIEYTLSEDSKDVKYLTGELKMRGFRNFRIFKHNYGPYECSQHGTLMAGR